MNRAIDPMLTRRKFLATTACTVIAARLHAQGQSKVRVALNIPSEATGPHMPVDFVGLSYEVQQLADPTFFSAQNSGLIREFKALSSTGVLRLGGNTSEFAYWKPKPDSPEPEHPSIREVTGEPKARYARGSQEFVRVPPSHRLDLRVRHWDGHEYPGARRGGSGVCS
jgi:hypothetical protein